MGDGDNTDDTSSGGEMPWAAFNPYFRYVKPKDDKNFYAECKSCLHLDKKFRIKSCNNRSSSNLKSHLKLVHKWKDEKINATFSVTVTSPLLKRKSTTSVDEAAAASASCSKDNFFQPKKRVTQEVLNQAIDDFMISTRQSHRIVDNEKFRKLVLLGLPSDFKVNCRQTVRKRMDKHFDTMKNNMIKEFQDIEFFASSADGWSKLRRGFLGVMLTWLDPKTLERKFAGLSLQRMKGRHTHDRIGKVMCEIFASYNLKGKIVKCTTDSGSNFVKAFRVFGPEDLPQPDEGMEDDEEDDLDHGEDDPPEVGAELGVMDLDAIMAAAEADGVSLPEHIRCGAHIINRMATRDALDPLQKTNSLYKKLYESSEAKLKVYWRRQNKSTLVAEAIQEGLGVKLITPGETRWNSRYDAKLQIVKLSKDEEKFNRVVEKAGLPKLLASEITFLEEYCHVMGPVAFALDILQKDKNMYLGYLVPTVLCMEKHLENASTLNDKQLKYCEPLRKALHAAIRQPSRFLYKLQDRYNEMAAALIPAFMLK